MRFSTSQSNWKRSTPAARRSALTSPRRRAEERHVLEVLEDRRLFSTLTVTSGGDSGTGSLRAVITAAQSGDTIVFASTLSAPKKHGNQSTSPPGTITLTSGQLFLTRNLTIQGPGAGQLTISGNSGSPPIQHGNTLIPTSSRVFEIAANTTVTVSGLTITKGVASAILNQGTLTINACTVSASSSGTGGGISNRNGTLTVSNCTVSGNSALYDGGGIYNSGGTVTISSSTVTSNRARFGGGINNAAGHVTLNRTTVSGNIAFHADYPWAGGDGGGIYNAASGTVRLENFSSVTANTSEWIEGRGPDVFNLGTIFRDSTSTIGELYGNSAVPI